MRQKHDLFQKINTVLKPKGLFVIADWIYPETEAAIDLSSPLVHETKKSYQHVLEKSGFKNIHFRDDSIIFIGYVKALIENLVVRREYIEKEYGVEIFSSIWHDHQKLLDELQHQRKFATRIIAKKT